MVWILLKFEEFWGNSDEHLNVHHFILDVIEKKVMFDQFGQGFFYVFLC